MPFPCLYLGEISDGFASRIVMIVYWHSDHFVAKTISSDNLSTKLWAAITAFLAENNLQIATVKSLIINNGPGAFNTIRLLTILAQVWNLANKVQIYQIDNFLIRSAKLTREVFIKADQKHHYYGNFSGGRLLEPYKIIPSEFAKTDQTSLTLADYVSSLVEHWQFLHQISNYKLLTPLYLKHPVVF